MRLGYDADLAAPLPDLWEHPGQQRIKCIRGTRCFMRTKRTPDEWADWCIAKNQIAEVLKEYYQACTTGELPPQLLTLLKKLVDELLKRQEQ
jgi:hypothetical protein